MPLTHALILAIIQGVTEFLPISSSAHLALAPWLLGWQDQGLVFDIALHFGTLAALLIYFFRDWIQILAQGFGIQWGASEELRSNPRLLWYIVVATIPVAIAGLALEDYAEHQLRQPSVIAAMLIAVAILMAIADRRGGGRRNLAGLGLRDALWIGAAQAVAVVPGTSRSGITITAGLFCGLDREAAARFSFLLSTPAIAGAALLAAKDLIEAGGIPASMRLAFVAGTATSALVGCLAISFLLRYLRRHSLLVFVIYRIIFGIIVLALASLFRQHG